MFSGSLAFNELVSRATSSNTRPTIMSGATTLRIGASQARGDAHFKYDIFSQTRPARRGSAFRRPRRDASLDLVAAAARRVPAVDVGMFEVDLLGCLQRRAEAPCL